MQYCHGLRSVTVAKVHNLSPFQPIKMMEDFLRLASENTQKNLETCGVLARSLKNRVFHITTLIIPKQESTSDSPYFVAKTTMPGKTGFDFNYASQSFNVLPECLFGKNTMKEKMEMTTPVFASRIQSDGIKMDMTTLVLTTKLTSK